MKWLFNLLKQVRFWLVLVFVLTAISLVILGYLLEWSTEVLILSIVILFFILIFILMFLNLRAARSKQKIEHSLETSDDSYLTPDRKMEIEQFRKKVLNKIQSLKKSKIKILGKQKSNLFSLPWYLFIGPPNSGKTTIIKQSEFNFSSESGNSINLNCDFFTSNTSVLLDVGGKILEEDEKRTCFNKLNNHFISV